MAAAIQSSLTAAGTAISTKRQDWLAVLRTGAGGYFGVLSGKKRAEVFTRALTIGSTALWIAGVVDRVCAGVCDLMY